MRPESDAYHDHLSVLTKRLEEGGWNMDPSQTKILMLTHSVLASEQGYSTLLDAFRFNDSLIKKEDDFIAFFCDKLEPACVAFDDKRYGDMFITLGDAGPKISSYTDKALLSKKMKELIALRAIGTVGDVLDLMLANKFPRLPDSVFNRDKAAKEFVSEEGKEIPLAVETAQKLRTVPYTEVIALKKFIDGHTPFATKHSVKGDEFKNVLVVIGRGWNKYNFGQYLDWASAPNSVPADKSQAYERNRNLFYVACSRPTTNLAILFTQKLSDLALKTVQDWFGNDNVHDCSLP